MDIKSNVTYPYPIWGLPNNFNGDDPEGKYSVKYDIDNNSIVIKYDVVSHNDGIDILIQRGFAAYECIIESKSVYYLHTEKQTTPHFEVNVPAQDVNKLISCKIIIVALQDINACTCLDVNDVYEGQVFYPKGAMIAYIDDFDVPLESKDDRVDLSKIITTQAAAVDDVVYDLTKGRIVVKYPKIFFQQFSSVESVSPFVIESIFVYPALVYALSSLHLYSQDEISKEWVFYLKQFVDYYYSKNDLELSDGYEFDTIEDVYKLVHSILKDVQIHALEQTNQLILDSQTPEE